MPIWNAAGAEDAVRQAFYRARTESRPIVLNAPMDVQQQTFDGDMDEYEPSTTLLPGRRRVQPDPDQLQDAAPRHRREPEAGHRGGTGRGQGRAGDAVLKLADRIGALIATTLPMKGWLGEIGVPRRRLRPVRHQDGHRAVR